MIRFNYIRSIPIADWGCRFDSLLELKYAISIQDDYEFLRSRIPIYYDPKTKRPTDYLRFNTKRYTPDFLIRHRGTNKASLIEIKPRAFENERQLELRREIAEKYIRWKSFDWSFEVVYDDQIRLNTQQQHLFDTYRQLKSQKPGAGSLPESNINLDNAILPFFKTVVSNSKVRFIMFGNKASR
jgi:TnsA endonuclease-like protein